MSGPPALPTEGPLRPGQLVGDAVILRRLTGRAKVSHIYLGQLRSSGREVAVKVLDPEVKDPVQLARFAHEGAIAIRAAGPGVVQIFEQGELPDGTRFLTMELLVETLRDRLRQRKPGAPSAAELRLLRLLVSDLAAVCQRGVLHRDLKPENLMFSARDPVTEEERLKLVDFGIAKVMTPQPAEHVVRTVVESKLLTFLGTLEYAAPEVVTSGASEKSEVYALGVIFFEWFAGRRPFVGDPGDVVIQHVNTKPPALRRVPRQLARLVARMLRKKPAERPSLRVVAQELDRLSATSALRRAAEVSLIGVGVLSLSCLAVWWALRSPLMWPAHVDLGVTRDAAVAPDLSAAADASARADLRDGAAVDAAPSTPRDLKPHKPPPRPPDLGRRRARVQDAGPSPEAPPILEHIDPPGAPPPVVGEKKRP